MLLKLFFFRHSKSQAWYTFIVYLKRQYAIQCVFFFCIRFLFFFVKPDQEGKIEKNWIEISGVPWSLFFNC